MCAGDGEDRSSNARHASSTGTTDPKAGLAFSQEFVGMVYAVGTLASMVGVLIYQKALKDCPFQKLLFSVQFLYAATGMLDLVFVRRWNLALGVPDSFFVIAEECVSRVVSRIRWMPMIVLSTKLCPLGIEGMFFALLMCIDSLGFLSAKMGGGLVLRLVHVTRTDFRNLWLALLIRNVLRLATLGLIFLARRRSSPTSSSLPAHSAIRTEARTTKMTTMTATATAMKGYNLFPRASKARVTIEAGGRQRDTNHPKEPHTAAPPLGCDQSRLPAKRRDGTVHFRSRAIRVAPPDGGERMRARASGRFLDGPPTRSLRAHTLFQTWEQPSSRPYGRVALADFTFLPFALPRKGRIVGGHFGPTAGNFSLFLSRGLGHRPTVVIV
ncbi:hypothetical protein NL676_034299 [Syzygium grande]|nr:hypothetical protein NL676_034299 [Syzygium grande]